ncbi:AraC family transcriptional regulator [Roseateles puraquae]|uniref:AraC family transcriptional regulator n=1 Tax=Roseateles puraquae TaxID=431059 RepID=A0A254N0L8_9BURK|nr:helix-turn-helix domain-containing protein [Roseateles puraquae]MDG0855432.1 AraC family transcriptional regulator [Roseateles puraquae]OWR01836.1 AraC family transcriptional regulator [Roseateles puraquae]
MEPSTRLWLPPLALAGCVRGVMLRDTRGRALPAEQRDNYFPATPLVSLFWWAEGRSEWLATPGFSQPPAAPVHAPVLFAGPFTLPSHTRNPGEISAFKLLMLPDAFTALTGVALDRHVNQIHDALAVLPPDWQGWAAQMSAAPDDAARLTLLQDFLVPRWQALGTHRPGHRYAAWTEALAVRAATSAAGRSLRQLERRIKAWAGLPMRELRAVSRAESAFYAVAAAEGDGGVNWAEIAAGHDYADQSHLCRETRRLTGFSPEDLRRRIATEEAFWAYRLWRG